MQSTLKFNPNLENDLNVDYNLQAGDLVSPKRFNVGQTHPVQTKYGLRRVLVGVIFVILGALMWTVLGHVAGLNNDTVGADISPNAPQEIYVVQSGDTLWSIAMSIDGDGDPRGTVDRLAEINGGSSLYIGQRLILGN